VADHIEAWLSEQSPSTQRGYRSEIKRWQDFLQARDVDPLAAERADIAAYKNLPGVRSPEREPAPATIARRLAVVSSYYRYLASSGIIPQSPAQYMKRPHVPDESATRGMDKDEASRYLRAAREDKPAAWVLVSLMLTEGLRVSEATGATIENVTIHQGVRVLRIYRKGGKRKFVTLGTQALDAIEAATGDRKRGPIALTRDGKAYSYPGAYDLVRRLAYRANLAQPESIRPHSLRHTFATMSLDAGVPLRDVQDAMSHSSADLTRRYDLTRDAAQRHPVKALERHLGIERTTTSTPDTP